MRYRNLENRCKKKSHFYSSEITAVNILEGFLMKKIIKLDKTNILFGIFI